MDGMEGGGRMNWCWCLLIYRFLLTLSLPSFHSSDTIDDEQDGMSFIHRVHVVSLMEWLMTNEGERE